MYRLIRLFIASVFVCAIALSMGTPAYSSAVLGGTTSSMEFSNSANADASSGLLRSRQVGYLPIESGYPRHINVYEILFFCLIILFVCALLLAGYFYREFKRIKFDVEELRTEQRRTKRIHQREIEEYKDREISVHIVELERRNRLIERIKNRLVKLRDGMPSAHQHIFNPAINEMERLIEADLWKIFEQHFLEIHPRFMKKLKAHYPDLSSNDIQLCAMIRANLTSKEISDISSLSQKTIEAARTKLRKKFRISSNEVYLGDFLREFN